VLNQVKYHQDLAYFDIFLHKDFILVMISAEIAMTQRLFSFTVQCERILALGSGPFYCPTRIINLLFHPVRASCLCMKSSMEFSFLYLTFLDPILDLHNAPAASDWWEMAGLCPCLTSVHHSPHLLIGSYFYGVTYFSLTTPTVLLACHFSRIIQ
jgi:hypothetical protein